MGMFLDGWTGSFVLKLKPLLVLQAFFIFSTVVLNKGKTANVGHVIAGTVPQLVVGVEA